MNSPDADGEVRVVGRAAGERLAVDRALEREAEAVALDDAVVALVLVAALLAEHALHLVVDVSSSPISTTGRSTSMPLKSISATGGSTS